MESSSTAKQGEIALWTSVVGNGSIHDEDGTIGRGLTMDIARGLSICEHMCYACNAQLAAKASDQEGEGNSSLIDRCLRRR